MAKLILEEKFHMNRISAVICEFNPFHNGHEALLIHARAVSEVLICVMSGNFTQRSECAVFDKYIRAEAALKMGADIVLELPFPYSSAGAELFAFGGVSIGALAGAEHFIFGSECGNIDHILSAASAETERELDALLKESSSPADGAAVRYDRAMRTLGFSLGANDKLGVHYIKAARKAGFDVSFEAFTRMCDPSVYRSATEIRRMIYEGGTSSAFDYIPSKLHGVFPKVASVESDKLAQIEYLHYRLASANNREAFFEGEGGVSDRLYRAAAASRGYEEFFSNAATKRYTDSRLRRAALYELLGVKREDLYCSPEVTLLLGASEKGCRYLSSIRKNSLLRIITKPSDSADLSAAGLAQLEMIRRADELYSLCLVEGVPCGEFLRRRPYIEK